MNTHRILTGRSESRMARASVSFTPDDMDLIEDGLYYYLVSTQAGGPEDHSAADIRRVLDRITRLRQAQAARA